MKIFLSSILLIISWTESARILGIFPTPSISHQVVFHALMKDLATRGHELTILTTDLIKLDNPNVTQIDLHDSYEVSRELNFVENKMRQRSEADVVGSFSRLIEMIIDKQLNHPDVRKLIERKSNKEFEVIILEHFNYDPFLALAEIYDCPIVGITSLETSGPNHEYFGNEANPVIHPSIFLPFEHGKLTFSERWKSLKFYLDSQFYLKPKKDEISHQQLRKYFPNVKSSLSELKKRVQLLFSNSNPVMGFIRPITPNTIQLGFMHIEPPKSLPEGELKTFLDNSKQGVIYMSLGSNVQSKDLSPEKLQIFLSVFRSLKCNVLWKFEADHMTNKPDNVMISKWLPQSDLLAHPAIKLFITQGGQQSMEEAIDRTVPMVVIPFLGDQDGNAQRLQQRDVGLHLEFNTLTSEKLTDAINEMLKPKYKDKIRKLRELVYDEPMTSREKAVWWTEYVIRHKGAKHLEYPGRLVPFYQRYWLDFIAIALFLVTVVVKLLSIFIKKFLPSKKHKRD